MNAGDPRTAGAEAITFEFREGAGRGAWSVWADAEVPGPRPGGRRDNGEQQHPNVFLQREGAYRLQIVGAPDDGGTLLRFERDTGHPSRHFQRVAMARTYEDTGNEALAERFAHEVKDYVTREPFFCSA